MLLRSTALRSLALAAGTLSVVRVPVRDPVTPADLRASTAWYPLVGLALAALPTAALLAPLPALPRAALALAAWVAVTGALHLDGWADCCDAAFAPPRSTAEETMERRHAIL
ncbi:MAG TPA: adenosylcobinamide-GDP ribazoletransferase, partial [Longimicrobium sp.]